MKRVVLSGGMLGLALASTLFLSPACAKGADCLERVIEIVKEKHKTTKTITDNGVQVYKNTWLIVGGKSNSMGPGWVKGYGPKGKLAPVAAKPVPKPKPPVTQTAVLKQPLPPKDPNKPRTQILPFNPGKARAVALSFLGVRHKSGGLQAKTGLNTPGLAYAFHRKMGFEAGQQIAALYRSGDFVLRTNLRPGDMIFHHSSIKGRAAPDMVGIVLGGGEMVYMSGSKKKAIRANYETGWWKDRYQGSRRILGTAHARRVGKTPYVENSKRLFEGLASYYGCGDGFDGSPTASGETFDARKMTAAHFDLPLGSIVEVTNLNNGRKVRVRVNDRGPYEKENGRWVRHSKRVIDLACRAAEELGFKSAGLARVRCRVIQ